MLSDCGELAERPSSTTHIPALLTVVGSVSNPRCYSGIPYFFLHAARRHGLFDGGFDLSTDSLSCKFNRVIWNVAQYAAGNGRGGYQYSVGFLESLWNPARDLIRGSILVNCSQLYPPSVIANTAVKKWFFIDQTLRQYFQFYSPRVGQAMVKEAICRERDGYQAADGIIVNSRWAAASVINDYAIESQRVHIVVAGANLPYETYRQWEFSQIPRPSHFAREQWLRLVFVGKDWRRKGLDRLLRALQVVAKAGARISLRVIGCSRQNLPPDCQDTPNVEWFGMLDKTCDPLRYIQLVSECHLGCLLSRAEAGGIALREYHALGLAAFATKVGGIPDHAMSDASIQVQPDASIEEIADHLAALYNDPERLENLRSCAWLNRRSALWDESVRQIQTFWPYTTAYQPQ